MQTEEIIAQLPYSAPFRFVDDILEISEDGVKGTYTFREDEYFYKGHFTNFPVTPGVILTETMAQIGVVCLGIYLLKAKAADPSGFDIALCSSAIDFLRPVFPSEKVTVISSKEYFRFNKIKCQVEMRNSEDKIVCTGIIAGILKPRA